MASLSPSTSPRNSFISEHGSFNIGDTKVQMSGMLVKKPFGGKKGKKGGWQKRQVMSQYLQIILLQSDSLLQRTAFFYITLSQSVGHLKRITTLTFTQRYLKLYILCVL